MSEVFKQVCAVLIRMKLIELNNDWPSIKKHIFCNKLECLCLCHGEILEKISTLFDGNFKRKKTTLVFLSMNFIPFI